MRILSQLFVLFAIMLATSQAQAQIDWQALADQEKLVMEAEENKASQEAANATLRLRTLGILIPGLNASYAAADEERDRGNTDKGQGNTKYGQGDYLAAFQYYGFAKDHYETAASMFAAVYGTHQEWADMIGNMNDVPPEEVNCQQAHDSAVLRLLINGYDPPEGHPEYDLGVTQMQSATQLVERGLSYASNGQWNLASDDFFWAAMMFAQAAGTFDAIYPIRS